MLVNCAAYQDGRKLGDSPKSDISKYVSRGDCVVWVALYEPDPTELEEMQQEFDLHELAVEDARHGHGWGIALLVDAVIRVTMAYTLPVDLVPGLGGALWPVTFVVLQVITNVYFQRAGFWLILRDAM